MLDSIDYTINDLQGRIFTRLKKATVRTPSGTVSIYQQLYGSFTHTSEEAATTATYFPDIAPAAILQSIYSLPHQHNTGCSLLDSTCECILAIVPFI